MRELTNGERDRLLRRIGGALKSTIIAHGPITEQNISSAAKRVLGVLRSEPDGTIDQRPLSAVLIEEANR
jgi:hypothetical protein